MSKIIIDRANCIGCGSCAAVCSKYFEISEDGKSHIVNSTRASNGNDELETDKTECAENASESCPVQCIRIEK